VFDTGAVDAPGGRFRALLGLAHALRRARERGAWLLAGVGIWAREALRERRFRRVGDRPPGWVSHLILRGNL
jgi:hypothetical protein